MNSICLITGDHPRHKYFVHQLAKTHKISSWVIETRENFVPKAPSGIEASLVTLFDKHFSERERIENEVFGQSLTIDTDIPHLIVTQDTLNSEQTINFINKKSPALVVSYGCHKLSTCLRSSVSARFWNTHGGLSPDYRGVTTHFWPSYFLEPQMTGMTLHETTDFLDGGEVIFQSAAEMVRGDTLHRLAARNVEVYAKELSEKLRTLDLSNLPTGIKQQGYGKVFMGKDWRPEHLRLIYETYNDRVVDAVIDGFIEGRTPDLISVL